MTFLRHQIRKIKEKKRNTSEKTTRTKKHQSSNHSVLTCALLSPRLCASSSLSAGERYFWYRKRFSSSKIWWLVNAVRLFRFFLGGCLLLKRFTESAKGGEKSGMLVDAAEQKTMVDFK